MTMREDFRTKIVLAIERQWSEYKVLNIISGSSENSFRVEVKKPSGSVRQDIDILVYDNLASIVNYAEGESRIVVNIETGDNTTEKIVVPPNEIRELTQEKEKKFKKSYKDASVKREGQFHLLEKKKIKHFGSAFLMEKRLWSGIKDPICVPFFSDLEQTKLTGAQVIGFDAEGKSQKTSIPGSLFKGSFHLLQKGTPHEVYGITDYLICESYTTACEIAEAAPEFGVICSAGMNIQEAALDAIKHLTSKVNPILVLDKVTSDKQPSHKEFNLKEDYQFIQLDNDDPKLRNMTDFNDFALALGKKDLKKEVHLQLSAYIIQNIEFIKYDEKGYHIINPITGYEDLIPKANSIAAYHKCSPATWRLFCKSNSIMTHRLDGTENEAGFVLLERAMLNAVRRVKFQVPRGVGLFKEDAVFIINMMNGDKYISKDGNIRFTTKLKPYGGDRYLTTNMDIDKDSPNLDGCGWTKEHFQQYFDLWKKAYKVGNATPLLLLGFMVQSAYTSWSQCRPHMWLTGPTAGGKSQCLNKFIGLTMKGLAMLGQDPTKAGLEQLINTDDVMNAPLICIDEAGRDTAPKKQMIDSLILTTRETFLGKNTPSFRGTQEQKSKIYYRCFSLVFSSVSDGLTDHQDLGRFLIFDFDEYYLSGRDFKEVDDALVKLNPHFIHGCLKAAPYYEEAFYDINTNFCEYYGIERAHLGHKILTLTSCLAGAAALYKVAADVPLKKAIDKIMKTTEQMVRKQLLVHLDRVGHTPNFIDFLKRTHFKIGSITQTLSYHCSKKGDYEFMRESYGVSLSSQGNLSINSSKFSFASLLENPKIIENTPIYNSKSLLTDLAKSGIISMSTAKGSDRKSYNCYLIKGFAK